MRINDAYKNPQITPATVKSASTTAARGKGGSSTSAVSGTGQDSVSVAISSRARELASANGGFDAEKVEELKGLVERGEFKVDPQKVAEKIVNESSQ